MSNEEETSMQNQQQSQEGMMGVAAQRQTQEVKAAMQIARMFPRDEHSAIQKVKRTCKRPKLAEEAQYVYPKGGQKVKGPSIRLAEALAQSWGNIDFGMIELGQEVNNDGIKESTMMAYAWDLETNTRETKVFQVQHMRKTKKGTQYLDDPREIYEMSANMGARRMRSCILSVIPGDVIDTALEECDKTLQGQNEQPLQDRVNKMLDAFQRYGVTQDMVEKRLGHKLDAIDEQEFMELRNIYNSLKDGMGSREDYFDLEAKQQEGSEAQPNEQPKVADQVNQAIGNEKQQEQSEQKPDEQKQAKKTQAKKKSESDDKSQIAPPPPANADVGKKAQWIYNNRNWLTDKQKTQVDKDLSSKKGKDKNVLDGWIRSIKTAAGIKDE